MIWSSSEQAPSSSFVAFSPSILCVELFIFSCVEEDDDDVEEREEEAAIAIGACEASVLVCVDKPFSAESLLKPLGRTLRDICPVSH